MSSASFSAAADTAPFGVYVHVPFCARRCDYCAFATWTDRHHLTERYLAAVRNEAQRCAADGMAVATTVFVGGGTPSMVPADLLVEVLDAIARTGDAEVTVECNPDTVTVDLLAAYRLGGVTRVGLGVQSMVPHVLASLGRTHDPANVERAVELIGEVGFMSWNMDLIYGAVGESLDDWRATIDAAIALDPPHISAYGLTVEPGTPLALEPERHPDDDDQADKYVVADERLRAAGLDGYEISNWARAGHESRHNRLYWAQGDYQGLGCAAHSHRAGTRWWNVRTPERYCELVEAGASPVGGSEELDDDTRRLEGLQLALRTREGVPAGALALDGLEGLVEEREGRVTLTRNGRLLANEVALRLS